MTNGNQSSRPPIVVGITGASGAVYATRLLEVLVELGHHVHLTISRSGQTLLKQELSLDVNLERFDATSLKLSVPGTRLDRITYHHFADFLSPVASGSALTSGMVICPCSGGTLSAVAHGSSTNLIQRAADVHLKERRKLILVPRETPLSLIYLDNMKLRVRSGSRCAAGVTRLVPRRSIRARSGGLHRRPDTGPLERPASVVRTLGQ